MLEMTRTDPEWKDKIITGDETWVYGYDPETKSQSAEWRGQDIAPNDFFLFPKLKAVLKGRHFDTREDIIEKSLLALKSIPKEAYKNCFDNWEKRWRWLSLEEMGIRYDSSFKSIASKLNILYPKKARGIRECLKLIEGLKQRVGESPMVFKERFLAIRDKVEYNFDDSLVFEIFLENVLDKYREAIVRSEAKSIDKAVSVMATEDSVEHRCIFMKGVCSVEGVEEINSIKSEMKMLSASVNRMKHENEQCITDLREDHDYVDLSCVASEHRPMVSSSIDEKSVRRIENEAVKLPPTEFNRSYHNALLWTCVVFDSKARIHTLPRTSPDTFATVVRTQMVETRSGKMQDPAQERIQAEESAKPQPGATIGRDASSDPVVLNPNIDIPKYDGTEDPRPWIESLEEIGFLYHWADYIISRYAAMNMTGSAKTWLNLHKASFTSWENIKIRLIQDFSLDANKEELRMKLNRMQHWNEPAISFAEDILVLCNKVDPAMEEETKIEHVIGGLKKEYSFALYLNPPKMTDDLLVVCKKMDSFEKKYRERVEKSRNLYNGPRYSRPQQQSRTRWKKIGHGYWILDIGHWILKTHLRTLILGRDFLKKMNAKIDCKQETIKYDLTNNHDEINFEMLKIKSAKDSIVPECSMKLIKALVETEDGEYIIEESSKMFQTNGLRLARSLINVINRETHIWITNPYPRPLKIMKNQTLAFGSSPAKINEQKELKQVLERYGDLFSSRLGRTNLAKHRIDTEDAKPIKHKPYRKMEREEALERLKKKRTILRTSLSKYGKRIEEYDVHKECDHEELLGQLLDVYEELRRVDEEIGKLIDIKDLEKDLKMVEEYREKAVAWKYLLKKRSLVVAEGMQRETATATKKEYPGEISRPTLTGMVKLPKLTMERFYGEISQWLNFWNAFDSSINKNEYLTKIDKFNYLKAYLGGTAAQTVEGFCLSEENYDKAVELLKKRFGKGERLIDVHMNNLLALKPLRVTKDVGVFRELYGRILVQIRSLESLGVVVESYGNLLCPLLLKLLPSDLKLELHREFTGAFSLGDLIEFLERQLIALESTFGTRDEITAGQPSNEHPQSQSSIVKYRRNERNPLPTAAGFLNASEADKEKVLDVEQGMDSKNTEEVKLLYVKQGTDLRMAERPYAEQGNEPKEDGVQDSENEPKGDGVKDSEAETKDNEVEDSGTAIEACESVSNSKAVAEGADQVEIADGEAESIDDIEERVVRIPASSKLMEAGQIGDAEFKVKGYYLPDRPVCGCDSRAAPVRPAKDGASYRGRNGFSLKRYMKRIHSLLRRIPEIRIKLRRNKFGVVADLKRYFQMIAIRDNDWDYLKFLWEKKKDGQLMVLSGKSL
ncbi:hypothetical protein LAZ67_15000683 [Cordylochernes scorpioides]|uniref:Retrotransposon gag domain-containing protein n=1 Tax=Cordylochernes scorpioides TaxID=51811 RepID=A0ABY6L9B5_9ARAC|nr:hypothetical protein LAZ67_15000683 [Cordylochernes scorpioides]